MIDGDVFGAPPVEGRLAHGDHDSNRIPHPEAHAQLVKDAEPALIFWLHDQPAPHGNGPRALAAMESRKDIAAFRAWANPQVPLPPVGTPPPMPEEWVIARNALRYVGALRDVASLPTLLKSLQRRPRALDVTLDGLMHNRSAILGMSLHAIGFGASDGLAEWGAPSAFQALLKSRSSSSLRASVGFRIAAASSLGADATPAAGRTTRFVTRLLALAIATVLPYGPHGEDVRRLSHTELHVRPFEDPAA